MKKTELRKELKMNNQIIQDYAELMKAMQQSLDSKDKDIESLLEIINDMAKKLAEARL